MSRWTPWLLTAVLAVIAYFRIQALDDPGPPPPEGIPSPVMDALAQREAKTAVHPRLVAALAARLGVDEGEAAGRLVAPTDATLDALVKLLDHPDEVVNTAVFAYACALDPVARERFAGRSSGSQRAEGAREWVATRCPARD
ncbi:MAG: hypothetical protein FJ102_08675 [Deltaproteobacteria bacterium]|nr:hypothetical protein [Deltaproteobacteria bacterium]